MLTSLIVAEYNGSHFTDEEILAVSHIVLTGGFETTTMAIANGVMLLSAHPEELAKLTTKPELWDLAVEEILRFEPPLEGLFRSTTQDTELSGCPIPALSKVRWVMVSGNRDADIFDEPDVFRVDRPVAQLRKHLSFGTGPHACIGAALARAEVRIALRTMFERLPGLHVDPDHAPERATNFPNNGYTSVHVGWDPGAVRSRYQSGSTN